MRAIFSRQTYQLSLRYKSALARGLLILFGLLLGAVLLIETSARLFIIPSPFPSLKSDNFYFDYKVYALESLVRHQGSLDCIIVGSSVAHFNLDPVALETAYLQETGQNIRCFNIGIPALTVETTIPITEAVLTRYHPKVVVLMIMPRDLMQHEFSVEHLSRNPWVAYQRGNITPENWARVNSYTLRYFTTWQYWNNPSNRKKMADEARRINPAQRGFSPHHGYNKFSYSSWLIENDENLQYIWQSNQTRQTFDQLIELEKYDAKIIVIEAPAYSIVNLERQDPSIRFYEQDYIAKLESYFKENDISFWRTLEIGGQIPESGWYDWLHLNREGAGILSQWVGKKLAENPELFK